MKSPLQASIWMNLYDNRKNCYKQNDIIYILSKNYLMIFYRTIAFLFPFPLQDVTITRRVTLIEYSLPLLNAFCVENAENQGKTLFSVEEC